MLTSSNSQYLHPDYLQPLPTTLDAKKSPLALLAQTCSSIGKDTTPAKPIIPPLERKEAEKDKAGESQKRPASEERDGGRDSKPGFRTIPPKEIPPLVPITTSGTGDKATENSKALGQSSNGISVTSAITRPVSATGSSSSNSSHGPTRSSSTRLEEPRGDEPHRNSSVSPSRSKSSSSGMRSSPLLSSVGSSAHGLHPGSLKPSAHHPSFLGAYPTAHALGYPGLHLMAPGITVDSAGYPSPLAVHTGLPGLSAAAAAAVAQSSALKAVSAASTPLSPYVAYARVRTPSGATTLVPVCRDPFCTNCQLTMSNAHLSSTCTSPGCAQCAHEKSLTSLSGSLGVGLPGGSLQLLPSISTAASLTSGASALSSFHSMYPHSALGTQVCNWVTPGGDYCGKRFSTPEDLLQHLRSHTSGLDAAGFTGYGGLGLPSALSACHSHYSTGPLSPNTLRRTYPTSLSPVSGLLGHSRYHPYKSPLTSLPTTPSPGQSPYGAVGAYYPYSLYGARLGAAAVP